MNPIRILSTKKLKPNQRQFLLNAGFSIVESDFIKTEPVNFDTTAINENLIFTSSNAVKSVLENAEIKPQNCFCVGQKTKELLVQHRLDCKVIADNALELAKIITADFPNEKFTFFRGNLSLETLPEILHMAKVEFNEVEVYKTTLTPQKINANFDGILFFSPSAVESFLKENKIHDETCFCIGATTAKALESQTTRIIIANQPSVENVIIQTINYYKTTE